MRATEARRTWAEGSSIAGGDCRASALSPSQMLRPPTSAKRPSHAPRPLNPNNIAHSIGHRSSFQPNGPGAVPSVLRRESVPSTAVGRDARRRRALVLQAPHSTSVVCKSPFHHVPHLISKQQSDPGHTQKHDQRQAARERYTFERERLRGVAREETHDNEHVTAKQGVSRSTHRQSTSSRSIHTSPSATSPPASPASSRSAAPP